MLGIAIVYGGYIILEPLCLNAAADTATTSVSLTVGEEISLSAPGSIDLSPSITMSQDTSVGSGSWTITTNSTNGYILEFTTGSADALSNGSGDAFTDVSTTSPTTWSEQADSYIWGYSAYGSHVSTSTWGDAASCGSAGASSLTTSLNYAGFATTTTIAPTVASNSSVTSQSGATTTLCVAAEQGSNVFAPSGSYSATITGTATTQ